MMRAEAFPRTRQSRPGTLWISDDRRECARHTSMGAAEISAPGFPPLKGKLANISLGGCFISIRDLLPISSSVVVHIDFGVSTLELAGCVCRQEPGRGIAIQFRAAAN